MGRETLGAFNSIAAGVRSGGLVAQARPGLSAFGGPRSARSLACSVSTHAAVFGLLFATLHAVAPRLSPGEGAISVVFEAPAEPEAMTLATPSPPPLPQEAPPPQQAAAPPPELAAVPPELAASPPAEPASAPTPLAVTELVAPPMAEAPVGPSPPAAAAPKAARVVVARPHPPAHLAAPEKRPFASPQAEAAPAAAGVPVAATAPRPPPPAASGAGASPSWRAALGSWLQSHRVYPDEARRRSEEGTALVRFSVARDGQVSAVAVVRSSGSTTLDTAAEAMFRGARLPPFSADMTDREETVTVPIRYRLEQ